jgi:pyruvoyl-dependent arginine decarboxylase (PvlArgDC)
MIGWKKVTMVAVTAGCAEGGTTLNAFDNALLQAGIGNINLIKVSSIVPPEVDVVTLPQIKPGAIVPTAYAAMTSETPGETIAAAVGYALPVDREGRASWSTTAWPTARRPIGPSGRCWPRPSPSAARRSASSASWPSTTALTGSAALWPG